MFRVYMIIKQSSSWITVVWYVTMTDAVSAGRRVILGEVSNRNGEFRFWFWTE